MITVSAAGPLRSCNAWKCLKDCDGETAIPPFLTHTFEEVGLQCEKKKKKNDVMFNVFEIYFFLTGKYIFQVLVMDPSSHHHSFTQAFPFDI